MPNRSTAPADAGLQIRLLGELQVLIGDRELALPASRKTRALLCRLAYSQTRHRRTELCTLLWDDAADPRAALRWSLTQLRHALGGSAEALIDADRDAVALRAGHYRTDIEQVDRLVAAAGDRPGAAAGSLAEASRLFRGEFIDGLELPGCYAYHEWCIGEREAASRRHRQILRELVRALADRPQLALPHARRLATLDPLDEQAHVLVMQLLQALGRRGDARAQYRQARMIFERELGIAAPAELERARSALGRAPAVGDRAETPPAASGGPAVAAGRPHPAPALRGRDLELQQFTASADQLIDRAAPDVLLLSGVAGIGKTRLLEELAQQLRRRGVCVLHAQAFEAERIRPFGFWIDALRGLPPDAIPPPLRAALRPLTTTHAERELPVDRAGLFDATVVMLQGLASTGPLALLVDDLHWIESSSAALLHHVLRRLDAQPLLCAMAARAGEIDDNTPAQQLLASLGGSGRLRRLVLDRITDPDALALLDELATPEPQRPRILVQAEGNPLMLLELVRATGAPDGTQSLLQRIVQMRIAPLSPAAAETVDWAAAIGTRFDAELLLGARPHGADGLTPALAELERHELIVALDSHGYRFSHDLIRSAAYAAISLPRRRLMHAAIARAGSIAMDADAAAAAEVLHHASLAELHALGARAAVLAGEHGLRLFANREADTIARRGMGHAARLPLGPERAQSMIDLLRIQVLASSGAGIGRPAPSPASIGAAIEAAGEWRLHQAVAQGHYLLSVLHQDAGKIDAAQHATLAAAAASQRADSLVQARQYANSARCLVELGREIEHARGLYRQADRLARDGGSDEVELHWCRALLLRWDGQATEALQQIDLATALARRVKDRWRQCRCLAIAAMIETETGQARSALTRAEALSEAARRLDPGAETPLAEAIAALARLRLEPTLGSSEVEAAILRLSAAGDHARLAWMVNQLAEWQLDQSALGDAQRLARTAVRHARVNDTATELTVARSVLARIAVAHSTPQRPVAVAAAFARLASASAASTPPSARARHAVTRAEAAHAAMSRSPGRPPPDPHRPAAARPVLEHP